MPESLLGSLTDIWCLERELLACYEYTDTDFTVWKVGSVDAAGSNPSTTVTIEKTTMGK